MLFGSAAYKPALKPLSGQELKEKIQELQSVLGLIRSRLSAYRRATDTKLIEEDDDEGQDDELP